MHHGIEWSNVVRMMLDSPSYETENDKIEEIALTEDNADEVMRIFNNMML